MTTFNRVKEENMKKLEMYVPVVARVHGGSHPEFHSVRKIFDEINEKIMKTGPEKPKLDNEFKQLREITDNPKNIIVEQLGIVTHGIPPNYAY
jgi:hypothetical protein